MIRPAKSDRLLANCVSPQCSAVPMGARGTCARRPRRNLAKGRSTRHSASIPAQEVSSRCSLEPPRSQEWSLCSATRQFHTAQAYDPEGIMNMGVKDWQRWILRQSRLARPLRERLDYRAKREMTSLMAATKRSVPNSCARASQSARMARACFGPSRCTASQIASGEGPAIK